MKISIVDARRGMRMMIRRALRQDAYEDISFEYADNRQEGRRSSATKRIHHTNKEKEERIFPKIKSFYPSLCGNNHHYCHGMVLSLSLGCSVPIPIF